MSSTIFIAIIILLIATNIFTFLKMKEIIKFLTNQIYTLNKEQTFFKKVENPEDESVHICDSCEDEGLVVPLIKTFRNNNVANFRCPKCGKVTREKIS